jgi:hypothetical protein
MRESPSVHTALLFFTASMMLACGKTDKAPPSESKPVPRIALGSAALSAILTIDAGAEDASAASAKGMTFSAQYTLSPGTMYVPAQKDWAAVKFKNDETKLLEGGSLSLNVDASGHVSGVSEGGALGAAVVEGQRDGKTIFATVRRKDPADLGLTGTLLATVEGSNLTGEMKLAEYNAAVVRVAKVTAKGN